MLIKNILGDTIDFSPTHLELGCGVYAERTKRWIRQDGITTTIGIDQDLSGKNFQLNGSESEEIMDEFENIKKLQSADLQKLLQQTDIAPHLMEADAVHVIAALTNESVVACSCDVFNVDDAILFPLLQAKMKARGIVIYTEHFLQMDEKDTKTYFQTWGFCLDSMTNNPKAETTFLQQKKAFPFFSPSRQFILKKR